MLLGLWQALIYLLREVQFSWQTEYSPCIMLDKLNFSVSSQHLELPCLVMQLLRIIIYSLHTASNVVKRNGFQQVRRAFHSFFLNHLSELDPKPIKDNIPMALCITAPWFGREMGEDKVQPLWTHPGHKVLALREFRATLLFLAPGAAFHICCFSSCIWNASSWFSAVLCLPIPLLSQTPGQLEISHFLTCFFSFLSPLN